MAGGSAFDPASRHSDGDAKIVAALERLSRASGVLLREEAQERQTSPQTVRRMCALQ